MIENEAVGTFDVKLAPIGAGDSPIGGMSIDKTFHGDLQGGSVGQMLAFRSGVEGSAGYVAMERVTGTLAGKRGSFTLQHSGLMDKGAQSLTVAITATAGLALIQRPSSPCGLHATWCSILPSGVCPIQ